MKKKLAMGIGFLLILIIVVIFLFINQKEDEKLVEGISQQTKQDKITLERQREEESTLQKLEEKEQSLHSGKLFAKMGDKIVYVNETSPNTDRYLYLFDQKENTGKRLATTVATPHKMYFDGEYIYYMPHHYHGKGIYRVDLQGQAKQIYSGECVQLWIEDNSIYFTKQEGFDEINQTPQGDLCRMEKDGSNITTIIPNVKNYFKILGDKIYYTSLEDRDLYSATKEGKEITKIAKGRTYLTTLNEEFLTYTDFEDGEKQHVVNTKDLSNYEIGRFGGGYQYAGNTYLYTRELSTQGLNKDIKDNFSLFRLENPIINFGEFDTKLDSLYYVYQGYAYFYNSQEGMYRIQIETKEKSKEDALKGYGYFLDGHAYFFTDQNVDLAMECVNLETMETSKIVIE